MEVIQLVSQTCVLHRILEEIVGVPIPNVQQETVNDVVYILQGCVQQCRVEHVFETSVPQIVEEIVLVRNSQHVDVPVA